MPSNDPKIATQDSLLCSIPDCSAYRRGDWLLATATAVAVALDEQIQQSIALGDYSGAADQARYYLPFIGGLAGSYKI